MHLGTDNDRGQISEHIFVPNGEYCLFILWFPKVLIGLEGGSSESGFQLWRGTPAPTVGHRVYSRSFIVTIAAYIMRFHRTAFFTFI